MIKFACCFGEVSTNSLYQYLLKKDIFLAFIISLNLNVFIHFFNADPQFILLFLISSGFFWLAAPPKYKGFDWQAGGASANAVRPTYLTRAYLGYPLSLTTLPEFLVQ